jgi:hypothetical protein
MDPGSRMGKKRSRSGSGSGMNTLDHISQSLETIFWVKILKFFDADANPDQGSGNNFGPGSGIREVKDSYPGSGINIPDPQLGINILQLKKFNFSLHNKLCSLKRFSFKEKCYLSHKYPLAAVKRSDVNNRQSCTLSWSLR